MTNRPLVEIIIPNWNGKKMLSACLDSLSVQTCQDFSVTVVDNGSADGSPQFVKSRHPQVKLIVFTENKGFSAAVNEGITQAESPWIFLLNNDMEVRPDCLAVITNFLHKNNDFDSLAVKMLEFRRRDHIDGAGDAVLRGGAGYRLGTMELDSGQYNISREVFGACAGAAVYSREFFARSGLFDCDFFAYLEDVDLNFRARHRGLRCWYLADAVVYHIGSGTTGSKINPFTIKQSTKNSLHVLTKNYPALLLLGFMPVILIYQFLWFCFAAKKKQLWPYFCGLAQAIAETPKMLGKRRKNLAAEDLVPALAFAKIITAAEAEVVESIMSRRSGQGKNNWLLKIYKRIFL
ncbi:MAG: glycosyl transferase family 2 [Deltaproteobacteria bacterium]|nr:MAG: glycosyl transferase family 2 [Deltaproteobacteria bacterium]